MLVEKMRMKIHEQKQRAMHYPSVCFVWAHFLLLFFALSNCLFKEPPRKIQLVNKPLFKDIRIKISGMVTFFYQDEFMNTIFCLNLHPIHQ